MVYSPDEDELDRPRGILSQADREYILSDKSGYSNQSQYKRENAIKERIVNSLLDFAIIEDYLDMDLRKEIFESFDANEVYKDDTDLYSSETNHVTSLTSVIAFLYRETKEQTGFHPPFSMYLEHGIVLGEHEPRTTYYGNCNVDIVFEKSPEQEVNLESIVDRVDDGSLDTLSESEMRFLIEVLSRSDSSNLNDLEESFTEWIEDFEEENNRTPQNAREIFSQLDHGNPHEYRLLDSQSETNSPDR